MGKKAISIIHLGNISLLHFFIDFLTAGTLLMALMKDGTYMMASLIAYNCLAFLLQPFLGHLLDRLDKKGYLLGIVSIFVFLSIGIGLAEVSPIVSSILLGIGNAFFHVLGGKDSMAYKRHKLSEGIFVSSGALALGLAALLYVAGFATNWTLLNLPYLMAVPAAILLVVYLLFILKGYLPKYEGASDEKKEASWDAILSLVLILLAVLIRSFQGFYAPSCPDLTGELMMLVAVFAFLGKALGGVLLEWVGELPLLILSSLGGIVSSFFLKNGVSYLAFVFSANLLMSLTLDMLRDYFPDKHGFAFGLAASLLIPGWALGVMLRSYQHLWVILGATLLAFIMLLSVIIMRRRKK